MDNLGDWLYIILLVVAGISGLVSSVTRKKQPTEVLGQPETYGGDVIPENDLPQQEEWTIWSDTPPPPVHVQKKEVKKTPPPRPDYFREGERMLTTPAFDASASQADDSSGGSQIHLSAETFQNMEELKKAVIYSEILNRKY